MIEMFRRGGVASVLVAAAVLAACGSDADDGTTTAQPTATATATTAETATSTPGETPVSSTDELRLQPRSGVELGAPAVPTPVPGGDGATTFTSITEPYVDFGTDAAVGEFPRTIRHARGETVIEARPQRIVVLDSTELNSAAELGAPIVGYTETPTQMVADYIRVALADATPVGQIVEPDLEAIAALRPDLTLSNEGRHSALYEQLSAIAPTVYGAVGGIAWRQNFDLYARTMGLEEAAAETVSEYEARITHLNTLLPDPRPTVSLIRVRPDESLRYYLRVNFAATVLDDLGFARPERQNVEDIQVSDLTLESLRDWSDAGLIVLGYDGGAPAEAREAIAANPLWSSLQAVRDGQYLTTSSELWYAGTGYGGAHAILDELVAFLGIDE